MISEANTQNAIIDYLEAKRLVYLRFNPLKPIIRRKQITFAPLKPSQKGAPDLIVFLPGGTTVFLEIKSERGKQSDEQLLWEKKAKEAGYAYHVVRSVDEAIEAISPPSRVSRQSV